MFTFLPQCTVYNLRISELGVPGLYIFNKATRNFFFAEIARFFEYYVRILALKIGDNLI